MDQTATSEHRIRVGITHGDMNGISYEVIIKTLMEQRITETYTVVVYGSSKVASYHRKTLNIADFNFNLVKKADQSHPKRPNIVNVIEDEVKIDLGKSTQVAGELAYLALEMATEDLVRDHIDVLVTAPINKKNIQSNNFHFPGHTEYLAQKFHAEETLMLMVNKTFRVGMVTTHIPLNKVSENISEELIIRKLRIMNQSLIRDFGIRKPRIAVLGLNPHAGDEGVIGNEEMTIIRPAIEKAYAQNILAFGPYPADGFFGSGNFNKFDGIMALYHDQGLIPFKLLSFEDGVNFTAGLPYVRTAPAHGTAYDIAGKNVAEPGAMRNALYLACDIFTNRKEYDALTAHPLTRVELKETTDISADSLPESEPEPEFPQA